jgi:hypothetical protein
MTSQEIERGNKIVDEFMEIPPCDRCDDCGSYKFGSGIYYSPTQMEYHSSWDWLMPVAKLILQLTPIQGKAMQHIIQMDTVVSALMVADIDKLYAAVLQFLEGIE